MSATATPVEGTAEVLDDAADVASAVDAVKRKYGLEFHVVSLIKRMAARGHKPRVGLRITLSVPPEG